MADCGAGSVFVVLSLVSLMAGLSDLSDDDGAEEGAGC